MIAAAVSGGMDSLLSLFLLKERGLDVMAVHAHFLPPGPEWAQAADGLREVCAQLDVPFHALDLHEAFDQQVALPFADAYASGLTPNPCAVCNPRMKFGLLFDAAVELGADEIATGHYVGLEDVDGLGRLMTRGADRTKDQSYFLSLVPIERLRRARFPLAQVQKKDVLGLLARNGLTPPVPKESQEICFVPDDDYQSFLSARRDMPGDGDIVLADGRRVGRHQGLWRHTQGQRRGLGVAWTEPLYVLDKNVEENTLVVGPKGDLAADGCAAGEVNFMVDPQLWPETVQLQTRYRQQAKPSRFEVDGDRLVFHFIEPHSRPTPGQVAAVYTEDGVVLGGGVIEAV